MEALQERFSMDVGIAVEESVCSSLKSQSDANYTVAAKERQLLIDSREFAIENRIRSWLELSVTLFAFVIVIACGILCTNPAFRIASSIILGLLYVRVFALYHDYMHSTIFRGSKVAGLILKSFGLFLLTPPSVWKRTHDHHHHHNSKLFGAYIGSFPIWTVKNYFEASKFRRLEYRFSRSCWLMLSGYLFVFLVGMCIAPFFNRPSKHYDCCIALAIHVSVGIAVAYWLGVSGFVMLFAIPLLIATAVGSYLFYVQHNFPGAHLEDEDWTYAHAAIKSSSYLKLGPVLNWFTANIGFHHVHHLNSKIPFYRLPEAHRSLTMLQEATSTTLSLTDVRSALRLKLWDESAERLVGFSAAMSRS
jgi:acyl-lipid omega-6 desaturase (Delta-12 desaturase)